MPNKISPKELKLLLSYDPLTGVLTWRERTPDMVRNGMRISSIGCSIFNAKYSGKSALINLSINGYFKGRVLGNYLLAHRVSWAIHYGIWPSNTIDHISGERTDNRIANLRDVTQSKNLRNASLRGDNTSGVCGISWHKGSLRWRAKITANGRQLDIGYYRDFNDAVRARLRAEEKYGYHENHGRTS
jgi:hypothetical protein